MKKFELSFYDRVGCTITREKKIIVEAKDIDEARNMAYNSPLANKYDYLTVGEFIEGVAHYGFDIEGIIYFNGKPTKDKLTCCIFLNAKSEDEIRRYFRNNMMYKFAHSYIYHNGKDELYDHCKEEGQDFELVRIERVWQVCKKLDNAKTISL